MNIGKFIQKAATLGGDVNWITLKDGVNKIRIVCQPGDETPWRECFRHFLHRHIKVDTYKNKAPICLGDVTICPACQYVEKLRQSGEERDADMARAQRRFLFAAFSRDNPFNDSGELCVKLLEGPPTVFQGLGKVAAEWDKDFTDAETGFDIEIVRTSQSGGGFTKYEVRPETTLEGNSRSIVQKALTTDEQKLVAEAFPDFESHIAPPEPTELAAVLGVQMAEPPVMGASDASSPATPTTPGPAQVSATPTTPGPAQVSDIPTSAAAEVGQCLLYGEGWEDDDSCRECDLSIECRTLTLKKQRTPVGKSA